MSIVNIRRVRICVQIALAERRGEVKKPVILLLVIFTLAITLTQCGEDNTRPTQPPTPTPMIGEVDLVQTCRRDIAGSTECREIQFSRFVDCEANTVIWFISNGMTSLPLAQTSLLWDDYCKK